MKCENFLEAMETGTLWRRVLARRHAKRCLTCAETWRQFLEIRQHLKTAEPLSSSQRRLWSQAAEVDATVTRLSIIRVALPAAAAVIVLSIGSLVWLLNQKEAPQVQQVMIKDVVLRQHKQIRAGLIALSEDLETLARHAALLDERQQVRKLRDADTYDLF
ncbi:MAG: hypothetical protein ACYS6W_03655 [Planctomycetota bacterium]|jgi:hypothetical protein